MKQLHSSSPKFAASIHLGEGWRNDTKVLIRYIQNRHEIWPALLSPSSTRICMNSWIQECEKQHHYYTYHTFVSAYYYWSHLLVGARIF